MQLEFIVNNNKKYEINDIGNSTFYARESAKQIPGLYYLVLWKGYFKEKNI